MSTTDSNWGSLQHFLPKLDASSILRKIEEKQNHFHNQLVSPIERLPSYRKEASFKDKPSRQHASYLTTQACSSYLFSPSPHVNLRSPVSDSREGKSREHPGYRSSFGVYSGHHRLGSSPPKTRGGKPHSLQISPPQLPSPKYSSRRTTHSHTMNLQTVREMYAQQGGRLLDDSSNYIYTSHKLKKNKIVKTIQKHQKREARTHSVLDPGFEEMNDSLMQTDLLQRQRGDAGSPQPQYSERITELGGKTVNIATTVTRRSPIPMSDGTTPELVEPKLLREIREARKNEELEEQDRKIGVLPLKFHMIKALNKVKKAGAVAQERAKFSTNNMERLKLELLQNRERFGYRQNYYQNVELDGRLEDLHRAEKLKQQKLDKKAKDDGTGSFVPYITAKMIAAAQKEASTVEMQVKQRDREEWMKKRKLKGRQQYAVNRERVQFAKSIFTTWDTNKNGRLDVHEIADPMISLGLSNTYSFVEQVIGSMKVRKKRQSMLAQIKRDSQIRAVSQQSELRGVTERLTTEKATDKATEKVTEGMSQSFDKAEEMRKRYQEREMTLRAGVQSGVGRARGVRKVNEDEKLYGLKGLGSKEGDVLTVRAFVQLFKTDKVSETIMQVVRKDYIEKLKREWEKKQAMSTMASRIASPTTFAGRKVSSPLRLELQTTKEKLTNSMKGSPLPGVEAFFAVSGGTYESEVVSAQPSHRNLPIHIDEEHKDYEPSDQRYVTQSSLNFGVPEPPDTTVFSFTGIDVNLSPEQSKHLSSLLNSNQKKELKKVRASIRASLKRIEVETQSMAEVANEAKHTGSKSVRPTSTFKSPRSGSQDLQGHGVVASDELKQSLRVKAMKNLNDKQSLPSAEVEPGQRFLFGSGDLPDPTQVPLAQLIPASHQLSSIGSSGKVPNFEEQHPSLAEQLEIVKDWWKEIQKICRVRRNRGESGGSDQILPVAQIVEYMVDRKIVHSRDLAERLFKKMLGFDLSNITFLRLNDFMNLFTRSLFRECILHAAREIQKHQSGMLSKSIKKETASRKASGMTMPSSLHTSPRRKQYQSSQPIFGSKVERFAYKHEYKQKGEQKKEEDRRDPGFTMDMKMSSYQRSVMIDGLFRGTKYHKLGKEVLDALVTFHNPSEEESSVYNIVRLIGELTGEDEVVYEEEEEDLLPLLEGQGEDEDELNWMQTADMRQNLEPLKEESVVSESEMSMSSLRLGDVVVPSTKQLKLCDWRKGGDVDAGKKPLLDELDRAIEQEFEDEEMREKMVPHRYKEMTVRQRRLADKQLIKQIQEFYTKADPLQVAKQMEHRAEEGLFF